MNTTTRSYGEQMQAAREAREQDAARAANARQSFYFTVFVLGSLVAAACHLVAAF